MNILYATKENTNITGRPERRKRSSWPPTVAD